MPCDSVITNRVDLKNVGNRELLEKALATFEGYQKVRDGWYRFTFSRRTVEVKDGEASSTLPTQQLGAALDLVKQQYSKQAVKLAAKRFGWSVEFDKRDSNQFVIRKG